MVSHGNLSDKSIYVSRTLLSILVDLSNVLGWKVYTRPVISNSSSPCASPLVTVPITIGIIVIFMFHSFFKFPSKVQVLNPHFTFFQFRSMVRRDDSKVHSSVSSLFFLLNIIRSGCLTKNRRSVCISKSQRSLSLLLILGFTFSFLHSFTDIYIYIYKRFLLLASSLES